MVAKKILLRNTLKGDFYQKERGYGTRSCGDAGL
jgi:hypothetical protein